MVWFPLEPLGVLVGWAALLGALGWALGRPSLCRRPARIAASPVQRLLGVAALAGVAAVGVALAKVVSLPMGVVGFALAGPALFTYAHVELLAAAHGYRSLDLDGRARSDDDSAVARFEHWLAGWTAYVTECHRSLPLAWLGLAVVAVPAAFVLVPPTGVWWLPLYAGGSVSLEAVLLVFATGYSRRALLPDGPAAAVRDALDGSDGVS